MPTPLECVALWFTWACRLRFVRTARTAYVQAAVLARNDLRPAIDNLLELIRRRPLIAIVELIASHEFDHARVCGRWARQLRLAIRRCRLRLRWHLVGNFLRDAKAAGRT